MRLNYGTRERPRTKKLLAIGVLTACAAWAQIDPIIEAARENVKVAAPKAALIQKIFVQVDSKVKTGDSLLQLDDRKPIKSETEGF